MREILLSVENMNLFYGNVHAVKNLSFSMEAGEIVAIIGANGSGKTSTVECLEGLRKPTNGNICVFGKDPWKERQYIYTKMGIQLQDVEYPDKIRVGELCALFASFYENPADWRRLLKNLGLEEKMNRSVRKLSGGEKQRLSVILALLPRPKLLILDELTTGLDPEIRHSLWESLQMIQKSGTGILLVSHYMDEVEVLADRLLYMRQGKGEFIGTLDEFRAFARKKVAPDQWKDSLTLEQIYLLLAPKAGAIKMEGIL